jgi:hypothetical protein
MKKISKFEVVLNKETFKSGESLAGSIVLKVSERIEIYRIKLKFVGIGKIAW